MKRWTGPCREAVCVTADNNQQRRAKPSAADHGNPNGLSHSHTCADDVLVRDERVHGLGAVLLDPACRRGSWWCPCTRGVSETKEGLSSRELDGGRECKGDMTERRERRSTHQGRASSGACWRCGREAAIMLIGVTQVHWCALASSLGSDTDGRGCGPALNAPLLRALRLFC